jgi:hypothetical protein
MQHNQAIFESLFGRNFSDYGNTVFLEELTEKHPYFSPAQFYLLQKQQHHTATFEKQVVKANVFFNNAHWLHFQLAQTNLPVDSTNTENFILQKIDVVKANTTVAKPLAIEPGAVIATINDLPDNTDEPAANCHGQEKEIEPMHIQLKMPHQNAALENAMLFEPMHLVDYFASQGIKLSDDIQTADKLGKQLKSFTEWLKTMKKVHIENEAENTVKADANVQVLAENSNADAEVLTESMAEVFARQGKIAKASEVYQKLSLLNPAKSTYFAAKLQNLKGL